MLNVRVKRRTILSTDHHLSVCSLRNSKPWLNKKVLRSSVAYRIKWEAVTNRDVRKQFASSLALKFQQLPKVSEDIEREWSLFQTALISSAVESCGRKRLRMTRGCEKRNPRWNQDVYNDISLFGDWYITIGLSVRLAVSFLIICHNPFDYVLRTCFSFVTSSI